jgi:hypothetical protein
MLTRPPEIDPESIRIPVDMTLPDVAGLASSWPTSCPAMPSNRGVHDGLFTN